MSAARTKPEVGEMIYGFRHSTACGSVKSVKKHVGDVVADPYVPRTVTLDDGPHPFGVSVGSTVFAGQETYSELAAGSLDLVVYCLDCDPEPGSR